MLLDTALSYAEYRRVPPSTVPNPAEYRRVPPSTVPTNPAQSRRVPPSTAEYRRVPRICFACFLFLLEQRVSTREATQTSEQWLGRGAAWGRLASSEVGGRAVREGAQARSEELGAAPAIEVQASEAVPRAAGIRSGQKIRIPNRTLRSSKCVLNPI